MSEIRLMVMKTETVEMTEESKKLPERIKMSRNCSNDVFLQEHASGTLKTNHELGFVSSIQMNSERLAYAFGYGFTYAKASLVGFGEPISECDETAYTLMGRYFKRYKEKRLFKEDEYTVKYLQVRDEQGTVTWEGLGVVVEKTSASCVPKNSLVYAPVCKYNTQAGKWEKFVNFA